MNKLSKYLSLIKFSFFQPKHSMELFQTYRQANEDSKQTILPHEHSAMEIENCLKSLFPSLDTKKDDLLDQTKKLGLNLQSFLEKIKNFEFPSKQKPYPIDYSMLESSRLFLYALCKIIKPKIIVETGVAYGLSTSYILQALYENKSGTLYSIDSEFKPWESELMIGSAIPDELKTHWKFVNGSSAKKLKGVLESVGKIDIFLHDSMHTYKNMIFEFESAWPHIKNNGFLLSDDILENNSFLEFYTRKNLKPFLLSSLDQKHMFGILKKSGS